MTLKAWMRAVAAVLIFSGAGCATVKSGTARAKHTLAGVGETVGDQAQTAQRKARGFWHWLFGGEEERKPARRRIVARSKPSAPVVSSQKKLPNYAPEYVGQEE